MKNILEGDERLAKIVRAFKSPDDLRTIYGIAKDADLSPEQVEKIIEEHSELFQQWPLTLGGKPIFRLKVFPSQRQVRRSLTEA